MPEPSMEKPKPEMPEPSTEELKPHQATLEFARGALRILGALLLAAGGLLGFVALAGGVIVWSRFSAAGIPADQVVSAYPRGELIAIASSLLMLFGLVGVLAVAAFYLIDSRGRATLGTARGLLGLLGAEGLAVILLIADAESREQRYFAGACFAAGLVLCAWVTFVFERRRVNDRSDADPLPAMPRLRREFGRFLARTLVLGILALIVAGRIWEVNAILAIAALGLFAAVPSIWLVYKLWNREIWGADPKVDRYKLPFERGGMLLIFIALIPTVAVPAIIFRNPWLWASLVAAACLAGGLWRAALLSKGKFLWFGIAIFASVPLYGTLNWMIQNVAEPQVQPMALIRKTDGASEYLQGLYVTQTDDRVYFATVATQGCKNSLVQGSGRLLWVPKSEVAAMAIGPLQNVASARKKALEMSYALAPTAEDGFESDSGPAVDAPGFGAGSDREAAGRRLEGPTVAVEPVFGAGLYLDPPVAVAGEIVSLRMTRPAKKTDGFGNSRHRRTLRLGGVPADILKERAVLPWQAEYVETQDGRTISLRKHTLYAEAGNSYVEISDRSIVGPGTSRPIFVRVADRSVRGAHDGDGVYLRLAWPESGPARLGGNGDRDQRVSIGSEQPALKPVLLRQAWDRDRIEFRVPEGATSGSVTIDCSQLVGAPLMHVQSLEARIAVTIEPGSNRIRLDGSRSRDADGRILSRDWTIQGLDSGNEAVISRDLALSNDPYSIKLTVTDSKGLSDTAQIRLMRISAKGGLTHKRMEAVTSLVSRARRAFSGELPATIEFDARPSASASSNSAHPDRTIAEDLRRRLFNPASDLLSGGAPGSQNLVVRTLEFGAACPADRGSPDGRVDVLVLTDGVDMVSRDHCSPVAAEATRSVLVPG